MSLALDPLRCPSNSSLHAPSPPSARVRATEKYGHIVLLRLKDGAGSLLPVYIGEFECGALVKEINRKPTVRLGCASQAGHLSQGQQHVCG